MNETLMLVIAEQVAFLALSGDDVVNADAAVSQMENIAAHLQRLSPPERDLFVAFTRRIAAEARERHEDERADFFESAAENLGLIPE